jgi:UDP:flavonoid glycosyltransferase YjiC (YdhE family)
VEAAGAGVSVQPPAPPTIREAVERVLDDGAYRTAAERIAGELRSHPPVESAVNALEELA